MRKNQTEADAQTQTMRPMNDLERLEAQNRDLWEENERLKLELLDAYRVIHRNQQAKSVY